MKPAKAWKVRPVDLRRMAESSEEPERQRKLVALAEQIEDLARLGKADSNPRPLHPS